MSETRTRVCPECEAKVHVHRGVCPECGHMTTWFKVRLYVGCGSLLLAGIGFLAMFLVSMFSGR